MLIELRAILPVEIVFTLIVDAIRLPVLMKLFADRLCREFSITQEEAVNVEATNDTAVIESETWRVLV